MSKTYTQERVQALMPALTHGLYQPKSPQVIEKGAPRSARDPSHSNTLWAEYADLNRAWSLLLKQAEAAGCMDEASATFARYSFDMTYPDVCRVLGTDDTSKARRDAIRGLAAVTALMNDHSAEPFA